MCLWFDSRTRRHAGVEIVAGFLLCSESSCEFLGAPWTNKLHVYIFTHFLNVCNINSFFYCLFGDEATRGMDFQRSPAFNDHLATCSPNRRAACALLGLKNYPEPFAGFSRITRATSLPAETHEIYLWQVY